MQVSHNVRPLVVTLLKSMGMLVEGMTSVVGGMANEVIKQTFEY